MTRNYVRDVLNVLYEELPDLEPDLADFYALLVMLRGPRVTRREVHDAWSVWTNRSNPGHRSLVPFHELSLGVQALDQPYVDTIGRVAGELDRQRVEGLLG